MSEKWWYFSQLKLQLFQECPRCFWLHFRRGVRRPHMISAGLPLAMDRLLKVRYDRFRCYGRLPDELVTHPHFVPGHLFPDQTTMDRWRNWKSGPQYKDPVRRVVLSGALDDCLELDDKRLSPLDYKTRGSPPRLEDCRRYYGLQLDCYALLLQSAGHQVASTGWLVYYYPDEIVTPQRVRLAAEPVEIPIQPDDARRVIEAAADCLNSDDKPAAAATCEYCRWAREASEERRPK